MIIKGLVIILFLCESSLQNPLSPTKFDTKSPHKDSTLIPHPLVITNQQEKQDISSFLNIWENRFATQSDTSFSATDQRSEGAPKVILTATSIKMINLIPQDAPHPLYSSFYEKLTDDFILDSLSTQTIDFNDPQLASPQGVTIKTMGGKDLVFKKDQTTNKFTVNDVEIEKHETITGDVIIVVTSDFLFNYYHDIKAAFDELVKSPPPGEPEPGFRAETFEHVPQIPESLKDSQSGAVPLGLIRIWENRLSDLHTTQTPDLRHEEAPTTVLAVTSSRMSNLIPQDAAHPLYVSTYGKLTDDFILDSLSTQTIDFNDPQLASPQGVTIRSMSGKDLLFRKDQHKDTFTVNGIEIENHQQLPDGTNVIIIGNFLFNNYDKVQTAFQELSSQPRDPSRGPFGEIIPPNFTPTPPASSLGGTFRENKPYPHPPSSVDTHKGKERSLHPIGVDSEDPPSGPETGLPEIPASFSSAFEHDMLLDIWKLRLSNLQESSVKIDSRAPKTILVVTTSRMSSLIPADAGHPLYSPSYGKLTDDFILDSLSTQTIDFNDTQLTSPQGVTIKSMSGKDLLFKKDQHKDTFTVNGIEIENHQQLPDGANVIIIGNFLFNNYDKVQTAFQELNSRPRDPSRGPFGEITPPNYTPTPPASSLAGTFGENKPFPHPPSSVDTHKGKERSLHPIGLDSEDPPSGPETGLPEIPVSFSSAFENDKFLNIWKFRLSKLQESSVKIESRVPVTILPVTYFKMINLIPQDAPHPLYSDKYRSLADNFILDSLSTEKIDFENPNLETPEGVLIKTFTGKDLVFKKDKTTGKVTVNGIDIESHKILSDQKIAVVLDDFLFNYYEDTKTAFRELAHGPKDLNGEKRSAQGEVREHSGTEHLTKTEAATGDFNIPQVPQDLGAEDADASDASQLVFLWNNRLSDVEQTPGFIRSETQPKTVLVVESFKMINLIPQDAPHPLYSPEHTDLTDRFILESLSTEDINFDDPKLLTPEGLIIKTMNGKDLTFKKDESTGKIQVNGIEVVSHKVLKGNTNLVVTSDFLFNLYDDVQTAFNQLLKSGTDFGTPWYSAPTVIPAVPKVLEGTDVGIDASGLVNVWENRLTKFGTTSTGDSVPETPKTVVAVSFIKMTNLTPQDAPNPLYSDEYEHLANGFILDSLSSQTIDTNDPILLSKSGKTIKTLSGRDLVFKKDESTNKLTINGIEVENNKTFEDGTSVFVISDFLFDHQSAVRSAFDALLRESPKVIV